MPTSDVRAGGRRLPSHAGPAQRQDRALETAIQPAFRKIWEPDEAGKERLSAANIPAMAWGKDGTWSSTQPVQLVSDTVKEA